MSVTGITAMMFLVLISISPSPSVLSLLHQTQQAEATLLSSSSRFVPSAYIIVDGKASKLQLEDEPMSQDRRANYDRASQGTISPGERFGLLIPQFPGIFKDVQSVRLHVNDDVFNENDYLQTDIDRTNTRDTRYYYLQTYLNTVPGAVGDGYTASDVGFRIFLWWQVFFTDGTDQTYLAIVHLKGDPCQEHGWVSSRGGTTCVDPNA
ncbi:MAG: hypothetical protein M3275_00745 [Thermoproteota archaeon]|nr:hypothetical protein [Thermoproteota archaeon]MDQ3966905.1 hypothetical protein [Thermoproteota archaeon]